MVMTHTITTPVEYKGTKEFTYGALVRHHHDFTFFKDFVNDVRLRDHAYLSMKWSLKKKNITRKDKENSLFSLDGETFTTALISVFSIIGIIMIIGVVSDLFRTKWKFRKVFVVNEASE